MQGEGIVGEKTKKNRSTREEGTDSKGVPTLKYGPNNNYLKLKEKLRTACMEEF